MSSFYLFHLLLDFSYHDFIIPYFYRFVHIFLKYF
nr:MAG TPA: hypothetical protein [Caudoviricetes sp.]